MVSGIPSAMTAALLVTVARNICHKARQKGKLNPEKVMTCLLTMMIETEQTIQKATQQAALIACAVAEGVLAPLLLLLLPSTGDGVRVDGSGLYSAPMLVVL